MACSLFYFPAFISLCLFYFLSLWTKVCTSTLDVWWLFGSTDILSNTNRSRGNSKTITLGQPPALYVLHAELEWLVPHMHRGKKIKQNLCMMMCKILVEYVVLDWRFSVVWRTYSAVLFCVCLPGWFSVFCVSKYNHVTEIELNVLQLP